jgi:Glyoxalase-like domain
MLNRTHPSPKRTAVVVSGLGHYVASPRRFRTGCTSTFAPAGASLRPADGEIPLEIRRQRVDAEASRLAALGATQVAVLYTEGIDHCAVAMRDPEGSEFDIN